MKILIFTKWENVFQLKCQKPIYLQDGIERMKEQWPTLFTIEKRILGDDWLKEELILQSYKKY